MTDHQFHDRLPVPGFSIRFRHMEATIVDGVVQVTARQAFVNEAPYLREGIYLVPSARKRCCQPIGFGY
jgi:hypothetical protein